jgi:tripartite-type tricarboxylate transporter receptor subunit TctC
VNPAFLVRRIADRSSTSLFDPRYHALRFSLPTRAREKKEAAILAPLRGTGMDRRNFIGAAGAGLAARLLPGRSALAQPRYPASPIRLIVPYAPGGVVDAVARIWADRMKPFGTIVIENQGGGGGTIGAGSVAHARPDGYTLLFGDTSTQIVAPYLMVHPTYDGLKDFAAVSMVASSSTAIVVHPSVPATNFAEFIKYAQANQAKLSFASAGTGTVTHLTGELFKHLTGTPGILHVPYRGAGPGLIDLIAGVVPMMTPNVTGQVLDFHRAGSLRILAVCASARLKAAPDIPITGETLPGLVAGLICVVMAPPGTPRAIIDQLSEASSAVVTQTDFASVMQASGLEASHDATPAGAQAFLVAERQRLIPIIEMAGLQPQ